MGMGQGEGIGESDAVKRSSPLQFGVSMVLLDIPADDSWQFRRSI